MTTRSCVYASLLGLGVVLAGCSDTVVYDWVPATLSRAASCQDLELMLKDDALFKMHREIDAAIAGIEASSSRDMMAGSAEDAAVPGQGGASATSPDDGDSTPSHSETNVQVEGVDEADIVKTDGNYIYVLHGRSLAIVTAWPTSELALSTSTAIEGYPLEMFVTDDRVVVYSRVGGQEIFQQNGLPAREDPYAGYYPAPDDGYGSAYPSLTKATVLAKSGTTATVAKEYYFEGDYVSSRRVGSQVLTVVTTSNTNQVWRTYPDTAMYWGYDDDEDDLIDAYEALRSENIYRIATASLEDFLAYRFVNRGGTVETLPCPCTDTWMPTLGSTALGLTQLEAFDLDDLDAGLDETLIVGAVQTVYANAESLFLAAHHWQTPMWREVAPPDPVSTTATHVHKFDIASDPAHPRYAASGSVVGEVHNQFSLDEKDGVLRIATTDRTVSEEMSTTVNNLFTMVTQGSALVPIGEVRGLAPGESIYSTRFVGNRGYVVTFRQVDPLFVFDISNPSQPALLAELKIPGFSEYMHPLADGNFLLTVGRDGNDWGTTGSPALQLFDVRDPTNPILQQKVQLPEGWSEAEDNHKAITFYQGMLAMPLTRYDGTWVSTLELYDVDVQTGITLRGSVDHSPFFDGLGDAGYCGDYQVGVRRGVFIDDYVYSVSNGGIAVNALADMTEPVATLDLPPITDSYDCWY